MGYFTPSASVSGLEYKQFIKVCPYLSLNNQTSSCGDLAAQGTDNV